LPESSLNQAVNDYLLDAKSGDPIAFQFIHYYTYPFILKYLTNKWPGISEIKAELIAEEVMNEVNKSIHGFDNNYPFYSWLLTIVNRKAGLHFKRNKETYSLTKEQENNLVDESSQTPEEKYENKAINNILYNTLYQLRGNRRKILILRYFDELDYKLIVKKLSLPSIEAARQLLYNALKECRDILDIQRKRREG